MSLFTRLNPKPTIKFLKLYSTSPSKILNPDSNSILSSKDKSKSALSLIKSEKNPEKIIDICKAASLTPDFHLDRLVFSKAINKLSEANYFEGIRGFIEDLKTRPHLKNERFFDHAIVLYGQAGMTQDAIDTFQNMDQLGINKTVKSLNALLFSCLYAKRFDEVKRIFTDFPETYSIEPDVDTYNTMIKSFCEAGESSSGYSIVAEMGRKYCKPNTTTFTTLIAGFYKEKKFEDVGKVLQLMNEHGIKPGLSTYNTRIQSLCKLGRSSEAKALLDGMRERHMKPSTNTYYYLIHGFCREGKLEDAKKLYKTMVTQGFKPNPDCYFTLTYFLCQGGDYETALEISKESIEKNWVPNLFTMKSLVEGLVSISKIEEAKDLVTQIKEKFPKQADYWKETEEKLSQPEGS